MDFPGTCRATTSRGLPVPASVVLFGSAATGAARADSDIDVLVVRQNTPSMAMRAGQGVHSAEWTPQVAHDAPVTGVLLGLANRDTDGMSHAMDEPQKSFVRPIGGGANGAEACTRKRLNDTVRKLRPVPLGRAQVRTGRTPFIGWKTWRLRKPKIEEAKRTCGDCGKSCWAGDVQDGPSSQPRWLTVLR